ncbi:AfsR/SARP family transcriptional regulator [Allokutzneria oryzae]|uniref:BTAD domain-containing putative transcriptional regulator n=1 Tax=Allokutzneria oryzae TaxID=1378989 RepID=A0ABV5ZRL1_9PSEU
MRFGLLGTLVIGDGEISVGRQQRAVLALLVLDAGQVVATSRIAECLWGPHPPVSPRNTVQQYVSQLRKLGVAVERAGQGYRVVDASTDLEEFRDRVRAARALPEPVAAMRSALTLWRGAPLADVTAPGFDEIKTELAEERLAVLEEAIGLELAAGRGAELVPELTAVAAENPAREPCHALLMTALYRAGRQAEALAVFTRLRQELGAAPSAALRELADRIHRNDPDLLPEPPPRPGGGPDQLPPVTRWFTGRDAELDQLSASLEDSGTVVISAIGGGGGIGKTTLALRWAHAHADRFPDGQLFVNLRGFDQHEPMTPETAVRGFLDALGVAPQRIPVELDAQAALYRSLLAGKRMLVVLDNARDLDQITPLLPGGATCAVIVTSRHRLTGLITHHGASWLPLDILDDAEARNLLAGRLGQARLDAEPDAVEVLLGCCAGLPLALAITAARIARHPRQPLARFAVELRDETGRLATLDGGDIPSSLRAVFSFSRVALSTEQARVLGLVGLAPGPDISVPAAASLTALPAEQVVRVLRELEELSLVEEHVPDRFRMHDLTRLYAVEQAEHEQSQDERETALRRLVDFYLHTAYAGDRLLNPHRRVPKLDTHSSGCTPLPLADDSAALAWFGAEKLHLVAVQQTALEHDWHSPAWHMTSATTSFLGLIGDLGTQLVVSRTGVTAAELSGEHDPLSLTHYLLGTAYSRMGSHDKALEHLDRALALAEETGATWRQAGIHGSLNLLWDLCGDNRRALHHATRMLRLYQAMAEPVWEALSLNIVGNSAAKCGDYAMASTHCEASLVLFREHRYPLGEADTLDSLGFIAHETGDYSTAINYYGEALALSREHGNAYVEASVLNNLGRTHFDLGRVDEARDHWKQALELYETQGRDTEAETVRRQLKELDD